MRNFLKRRVKKTSEEIVQIDFHSYIEGRYWPFFEDEDATGFYGYDHQDPTEFAGLVNEYIYRLQGEMDPKWAFTEERVEHKFARTYKKGEDLKFTWRDVDSETPDAYPITMIRV